VTLDRWSERRVIGAMRGWRVGCRVLLPWFRATPFAAAHHYRDRTLHVTAPAEPPRAIQQLTEGLPPVDPSTLWVVDLPGVAALWFAYRLRRRRAAAAALVFNGWYDPEGCLDGRAEVPLLLALGERLRGLRPRAEAGLVFDRCRLGTPTAARLDNRYRLGEEDFPSLEQLRETGRRRITVFTEGDVAPDLAVWLDDVRSEAPVQIVAGIEARVA
jgi:hypothetical protein